MADAKVIDIFAAASLRAAEAAPTIPCGPPRLPIAVQGHPGAVELIFGTAADETAVELWLSPDQSEELATDLLRSAKAARAVAP